MDLQPTNKDKTPEFIDVTFFEIFAKNTDLHFWQKTLFAKKADLHFGQNTFFATKTADLHFWQKSVFAQTADLQFLQKIKKLTFLKFQ